MKMVMSVWNIQNSNLLGLAHIVERWIPKPRRLCGAWEETRRLCTYCRKIKMMSKMNSPKDFWRVSWERKATTKQAWKIYKHSYFKKITDRFVCVLLVCWAQLTTKDYIRAETDHFVKVQVLSIQWNWFTWLQQTHEKRKGHLAWGKSTDFNFFSLFFFFTSSEFEEQIERATDVMNDCIDASVQMLRMFYLVQRWRRLMLEVIHNT